MWTHAIAFSTPTVTKSPSGIKQVADQWGDPISANFKDATRNDAVAADQLGYTADQIVEIHKSAYNGQSYFKDITSGDIYDISRSFSGDGSMSVLLTCSKRERGKVVQDG